MSRHWCRSSSSIYFILSPQNRGTLTRRRDRESDVLGALSDIYSDLSEASMNFQAHYGVTLPFNVPSSRTHTIHTLCSRVCARVRACIRVVRRHINLHVPGQKKKDARFEYSKCTRSLRRDKITP